MENENYYTHRNADEEPELSFDLEHESLDMEKIYRRIESLEQEKNIQGLIKIGDLLLAEGFTNRAKIVYEKASSEEGLRKVSEIEKNMPSVLDKKDGDN